MRKAFYFPFLWVLLSCRFLLCKILNSYTLYFSFECKIVLHALSRQEDEHLQTRIGENKIRHNKYWLKLFMSRKIHFCRRLKWCASIAQLELWEFSSYCQQLSLIVLSSCKQFLCFDEIMASIIHRLKIMVDCELLNYLLPGWIPHILSFIVNQTAHMFPN